MSSIQIVTDTMADMPKYLVDKYNIILVPLSIHFGNEEYIDGVDLTYEEFYEKLSKSDELPKTSQVSPNRFIKVFEEILDQGKEIICINGSSKASGTYQSALIAKNEINSDKIHVFDTMALSFGAGFFVYEAAKLAAEGRSKDKIIDTLESMKFNIDHIFTVDTIEYLKKGGRLNPMKAAIATVLNVKPILTVKDGLVEVLDKIRGSKKVITKVVEIAKNRGGDFSQKTIAVAHANDLDKAMELKNAIIENLNPKEIIVTDIGCTIGTHAGPGTLAIFYNKH
ncbi:MAG: DegV family protein [Clostridiales bacterium]|nr:DegV family protein [Clostridiales bacterium]